MEKKYFDTKKGSVEEKINTIASKQPTINATYTPDVKLSTEKKYFETKKGSIEELAGKLIESKLDPVNKDAVKKKFDDRKDKDIDNDGDVDDSDKFLHKKRKAISKAIGKSEEKEDEKKDVKEVADKEKEMKKEVADKEKEKDMKEVAEKDKEKEVKEVADKEDEKKKEVSEVADKEKEAKKEMTAKDKVKDMDMKEDVAALTDGEDLSEEFKQKASTIFEAAVKAKLVEEIEKLEGEYETKVAEKVEETKSEIVEKVDAYLNYVVEEWMKENELAIEKGLRAEITEDFIGGLKSLFESHYINVPQEKYDVIEAQTAEIEKLKEEVNSTIEKNVELNQAIGQHVRTDIINDVTSDLAETETEKLKGLAESIEYKDAESFRTSVETLKNSYFPKAKASETESNEVAEQNAGADLSESMAAYTAAISKSKKNPYLK